MDARLREIGDEMREWLRLREIAAQYPYSDGGGRPASHKPKRQGIWKRVRSFVKAVTSPKVSVAVLADRMKICDECAFIRRVDNKSYCGACGCGKWKLAELHTKLRFSETQCPKNKFAPPGSIQQAETGARSQ